MPKSVMVIGGGIAGIECALNIADYGANVYLVEDTSTIGGLMARLNKTFPTNDCSICIEAPKMYELQRRKNITMMTNCDIRRVEGTAGKFKVRLVRKPRFVDEEKCKGCGKCVEACPLSVDDEMDGRIGGKRKLVYVPIPQAVPNVFVVDPRCRFGKLKSEGACIGACLIDCIQCRECPIARCVKACKDEGADAILLWQREQIVDIEVSGIVIASGVEAYEPPQGTLGYGIYPDVITHLQYERLTNAGGPTGGEIERPSDKAHPKRIVWLQCVGRDTTDAGVHYCSKICCMAATKQAIITKEHDEKTECTIIYMDIKTHGKGFHDFFTRAKDLGVKYVRGRAAEVRLDPDVKSLVIRYEDTETGNLEEAAADLLVLSVATMPAARSKKLAKILKVEVDDCGFIREKNPVTAPLETSVPGIYVCGGACGPGDIAESVAQAVAAGMKAVSSGGEK